jgi:hypothetical protein
MASFSSNLFSYMLTRKPKDIVLFFIGIMMSLGLFFGGGIFIAHLFVPGFSGILLGMLLGIGAIFAIAFASSFSYLAKIRKML